MNRYVNYHAHSQYSNVITPDVTITNNDKMKRTVELGLAVLSGIEHGWTGNYFEVIQLAKKNNLKPLLGVETYFVKDRFESDKTNSHLMLLAKNENGRKEINKALSEANKTGFYYKARMDKEIVSSLSPDNVWCTTACLGGIWKYEDHEELLVWLKSVFKDSFFLEVQPHHTESQKELNNKILHLSHKYSIPLIAGMDSHMLYPEQAEERDNYLASRGIFYEDEVGWFLDYPDYETAFSRFQEQGVLTDSQIKEAMQNTLVLENVEEYNSSIFDLEKIKLPTLYPDKTQKEKDDIFSDLIWRKWEEEKTNVPSEKWDIYEKEIKKELSVVFETSMSDYFLLDYEIVKRGVEKGGMITLTGRGSAPSFYITKLIGLTTVDRISASVKLFPERFVTKERILEAKTLPDIDLNLGNPEVFAEAQEEILGVGHSYPMIAYVTLKALGAWKMYARVSGVDFETANNVSDKLREYEFDLSHAEEDEEINIADYLDEKSLDIYENSLKYLGLVNSLTVHPCAYLIFSEGNIEEEFGLIKIKTGKVEHIAANCDGNFAEKSHLLKNDLLKVNVVDLIHRVYKRVGIKPHPLPELLKICETDKKVWDIYKKQAGIGINQVEQSGTITRVSSYAPSNISELSAFVAAIRPGFKSNYKQFEERLPFEYGIKSLDNLIQTEEFPQSYMLYQENAMAVMAYAGISISKTYEIVKAIAKKRYSDIAKEKKNFINGMKKKLINEEGVDEETSSKTAKITWQIIEDSSKYLFNGSHSYSVAGDSLYGAYLKANYPIEFYEVFLKMMEESANKDRMVLAKEEARNVFSIDFPPFKFGQDNREIKAIPEKNRITSSLNSIKGFKKTTAENLYRLSLHKYNDFVDLLIQSEEKNVLTSEFESLIKIGYFSQFGGDKKLLTFYEEFKKGKNRYSSKHSDKTKEKRIVALVDFWKSLLEDNFSVQERLENEFRILGEMKSKYRVKERCYYVLDVDTTFSPKVTLYNLKTGKTSLVKIYKKQYKKEPVLPGELIYCLEPEKRSASRLNRTTNEWVEIPNKFDSWLTEYYIIEDIKKYVEKR